MSLRRTPLLRRTGLSPGTVALRRTPLAQRSPERVQEDRLFAVLVARLKRERPWCEARLTRPCMFRTSPSQDPHHKHPVGRGGKRFDEANIAMCCRFCHTYLTHTVQGQREARQRGLTIGKELPSP